MSETARRRVAAIGKELSAPSGAVLPVIKVGPASNASQGCRESSDYHWYAHLPCGPVGTLPLLICERKVQTRCSGLVEPPLINLPRTPRGLSISVITPTAT